MAFFDSLTKVGNVNTHMTRCHHRDGKRNITAIKPVFDRIFQKINKHFGNLIMFAENHRQRGVRLCIIGLGDFDIHILFHRATTHAIADRMQQFS